MRALVADARLALPAMVAWATVALLVGLPSVAPWAAGTLWAAAAATLVIGRRRPSVLIVALALGAAALLTTIAVVQAPARQPPDLLEAARAGRHLTVVVSTQQTVTGDRPFEATIDAVRIGARDLAVRVPVTVFATDSPRFSANSQLQISGTLVAGDPGETSAFRLFATAPVVERGPPPWWLGWADPLRHAFGSLSATLPGDGGQLLPGLAIGDTTSVSDSLVDAMKASSLTHLTAVSGANCAVVVGLAMLGGARLGASRGVRIAASLVLLAGFVVLVTPQPSVVRAAAMAVIALLTLANGRPVSGLPVLSLAVIVLLASDPWLSRSYGFVLSVFATAGLLVFARPLAERLSRWMPRWIALIVAVPLAAQLACQPVLILLNPVIPTYGVIANVLAEPAAPVATVVGLLGCVFSVIAPPVGLALARIAWFPSAWIAGVARVFEDLPGAAIPWPGGIVGVVSLALGTVLVLALSLRLGGARARAIMAGTLALSVTAVVAILVGGGIRTAISRPSDWQIAMCDIGQGDASVVRSEGKIAVIDTGPKPDRLDSCLSELGIGHIDLLVLTHYDLDHVGGTTAVLGRVTRALVGPSDGSAADELVSQLVQSGANVEQASRGLTGVLGQLRWEVLWPKSRLGSVEPGNAASVTVEWGPAGACHPGCLTSLFLGDLGEEAQSLMMAANRLGPVDVVKVAHHGSSDQDARLYETVKASVGLIGVGADNSYGHPTSRLLDIVRGVGTTVARTDEEGMLLVTPREGGGATLWTERAPDGGLFTPGRSRSRGG